MPGRRPSAGPHRFGGGALEFGGPNLDHVGSPLAWGVPHLGEPP